MSGGHSNMSSSAHSAGAFTFSPENLDLARRIIARYPEGRQASALLPLLDIAQRQNKNWLSSAAIDAVADFLGLPRIRAYEVASFYTMFKLKPVGHYLVQVCTTTPCWLVGSDGIMSACRSALGIAPGETTADGMFTLLEVECLGACVNAPMMQVNDDYYEDLTADRVAMILAAFARGEKPNPGTQSGRKYSMPQCGATSLVERARREGVPVEPSALQALSSTTPE